MAEAERIEPRPRRKRQHRWAFPLGLAIIALAVIGVITIISSGVNGVKKLTDNSKLKAEYEQFLVPVVMNDPDPFDDLSKANMSQLLDSSIWALLKSGKNPDEYKYIDDGDISGMVIPKDDVKYYFEKLFGTEIQPVNMSVQGGSLDFIYDETRQSYIVPITGEPEIYTPKVYNIDKKGDSIILTVGYLAASDWKQDAQGNFIAPEPNKYMKITLRVKDKSYYISAIQATDALEVADSTSQPQTTATVTTQAATAAPTAAATTAKTTRTTTKGK